MKSKNIFLLVLAVGLAACNNEDVRLDVAGMFSPNGPTNVVRFEQSEAYNATRGEIHIDMASDNYQVYACTDSHITRRDHRNLAYFVNASEMATGPKMAVFLGDLIDAQNNFPCADSVLNLGGRSILDTIFLTPGNHDIYFKQWDIYRSYFKTGTYWFDTNNGAKKLDLFICVDSSEGTLGIPQLRWLRNLLEQKSQEGYRHIIVFTHTHLWKLDTSQGVTSNFALEETYELTDLLGRYGVDFVWSGHQHARQSVIYKDVQYLVLNATKDSEKGQSYMIADMADDIIYHYIDYPKIEE